MQKLLLFLAFPIIWNIPHLALDLNSRPLSSLVCQTSCFTTTPRLPSIKILNFQLFDWYLIFWIFNWKPRNLLLKVVNITDIILVNWVDNFLIASMLIQAPNFTIHRCIIYFNRIVTYCTTISRNFDPTYDCLDVLYL